MWLLLDIVASLTFLYAILNFLKQDTFNGCNACDVCDGSVIMFNPKKFAYLIAYRVTWLPCPFKINKCWLLKDIPLGIDLLKKDKNSLYKKVVIHALFYISI
jgi:hypothetical protein